MPFNLALIDLVSPYLVRGENLGANHAPLSAIRVTEYDIASDEMGVVIQGRCEFNGQGSLDIGRGSFTLDGLVDEGAAPFDPNRRAEVFDLKETSLSFELWVPRIGSNIIFQGADDIDDDDFSAVQEIFDVWDAPPLDAPLSDFPNSAFTLDLILNAPTVRPPFLQPAQMTAEGLLIPDDSYQEVTITLPKLRFRFLHTDGDGQASSLRFQLLSAGVSGLDDPGELGIAELISMEPPYAFVGRASDRTIGFGFRSAVLDLSNDKTPPAVVEKFGFGDDWGGLYLPEARLFVAPEGAKDFAFEAGVRDLLIGFGNNRGVSGDFEVALINQGSGAVEIGARFFDEAGAVYEIERTGDRSAVVRIPPETRMVVDIQGGRAPYDCTVRINDGSPSESARLFNIELGDSDVQEIDIRVLDRSFDIPIDTTLIIRAERLNEVASSLPVPGGSVEIAQPVSLTSESGSQPQIVIVAQNNEEVWLTTTPTDPTLRWSVPGSGDSESDPISIFSVPVAPGETVSVQARREGAENPGVALDDLSDAGETFYFYFDEPEKVDNPADEENLLYEYATTGDDGNQSVNDNVWSSQAIAPTGRDRLPNGEPPLIAYAEILEALPAGTELVILGHASYENDSSKLDHNFFLARRRAIAVRELIQRAYPEKLFNIAVEPDIGDKADWSLTWQMRSNQPQWWAASLKRPAIVQSEQIATVTLSRPASPPAPPLVIPVVDEPPLLPPRAPAWFRSVALRVRIVRNELIAGEIEAEVDLQTATEAKLNESGQLPDSAPAPDVRSLESGSPLAPDNPADGITKVRLLAQSDSATGLTSTLIEIGADPSDKDGLAMAGWLPDIESPEDEKNVGLTLLGSYLSFWPLLVNLPEGNSGRVEDAVLTGAALALPGTVALLPWFRIERVILYGGEFLKRDRNGEQEAFLLFDVQMDWSVRISLGSNPIVTIDPEFPLSVRYKAIGLRFGQRDSSDKFSLRPVFDASRGYTIDVAKSGVVKVADPFGRILRVLAARISKTNPTTFEIDLGMAIDLGVVSIDRAGVRVYLDAPEGQTNIPRPELTALGASVDIKNTLTGRGYLQIGENTIGGEIDLAIAPIDLRVSAALEITQFDDDGTSITGVYVSISVVLPVGIPLGASGLGIFGFRGIFGMHYERSSNFGINSAVPALAWLEAAEGEPHRLRSPEGQPLWVPMLDSWAFGLGMLIGTMEGGILMNLDGTFLLELPGPRILIVMNARILSPPPSVGELGAGGGILAVIEITREHFLIGIIAEYEVPKLISIRIPIEAVFSFTNASNWHVYLGSRQNPVTIDVLGLVQGTGYLMLQGNGLAAYKGLDAIEGFAVGIGAAASFRFGGERLYLEIGGSMDAILGFVPFVLQGIFEVRGELRLFIISIGAHATLFVSVREPVDEDGEPTGDGLETYIHGEVCGHINLFFFKLEGCVTIEIGDEEKDLPLLPNLITKLSLQSRAPALAEGTGVDRPIDASLTNGIETEDLPNVGELAPVPIDSIIILSMMMPAQDRSLTFFGEPIGAASGAPALEGAEEGFIARGEEQYRYSLVQLSLERINPADGSVEDEALIGSEAPAVWWLQNDPGEEQNITAQLALMTWVPTPVSKAILKGELLRESVEGRWGQICEEGAPAAAVLWTFRYEQLGTSYIGWNLEGIAWPDPPETKRSEQPDTSLPVGERWRSGNLSLDNKRGIIGATVINAGVPCDLNEDDPNDDPPGTPPSRPPITPVPIVKPGVVKPGTPPVVIGGRGPVRLKSRASVGEALAEGDSVRSQLSRRANQQPFRISQRFYQKAARSLRKQTPLDSRHNRPQQASSSLNRRTSRRVKNRTTGQLATVQTELLQTLAQSPFVGLQTGAPSNKPLCEVRLLSAPVCDDGRAIVFGNPQKQTEVEAALAEAGVTHGPLDEVVVLKTGAYQYTRLLLFSWAFLVKAERLIVRSLDAEGNEINQVVVSLQDHELSESLLPSTWSDPQGPWYDSIVDIVNWGDLVENSNDVFLSNNLIPFLITLEDGEQADRIEIGLIPHQGTPSSRPRLKLIPNYYVAAMESLRGTEVARSQWDDAEIQRDRAAITQVFGPDGSDNALLYPDALYRITTTWSGARKTSRQQQQQQQQEEEEEVDIQNQAGAQTFWFRTDSQPPERLDAWMMMTIPADDEKHVFRSDPLRLVFNTHDIQRLFAAYGHSLQVRLQAASAHHPEPQNGQEHPAPINDETLLQVGPEILSPWESTLQDLLEGQCIDIDDERDRHGLMLLNLPLDPYTNYILDVESVEDESESSRLVYRRHFSTGAYENFEAFARSLQAVKVSHRAVPPGSMGAVRDFFSSREALGAEFDQQWREQGLEVMPVPDKARIVVMWEQAGNQPPQPTAVLIDASEPMWRSRPYPIEITDDSGPRSTQRWILEPKPWLTLDESSESDPVLEQLIQVPGAQRALAILRPNSRGQLLALDLAALGFEESYLNSPEQRETVVTIRFNNAPWEEVDS